MLWNSTTRNTIKSLELPNVRLFISHCFFFCSFKVNNAHARSKKAVEGFEKIWVRLEKCWLSKHIESMTLFCFLGHFNENLEMVKIINIMYNTWQIYKKYAYYIVWKYVYVWLEIPKYFCSLVILNCGKKNEVFKNLGKHKLRRNYMFYRIV